MQLICKYITNIYIYVFFKKKNDIFLKTNPSVNVFKSAY